MFCLNIKGIGDLYLSIITWLDIFNILRNAKADNSGEIQITDALLVQAKQGKVIAYKFKGKRFDCGGIKGYLEATNHFAKKLSINS